MGEAVDGRRARGERRRAELLAATLRVVARDGAAKVTHRAVAKEAGAPPSSAVYYFATIDDLLVATLTEATEDYLRRLREALHAGDDPVRALGGVLSDGCRPGGRERVLAEFELSLLAARRPSLRPVVRRWNDLVAGVARRYTDDPVAVRAAVAAANGLSMEALLAEEDVSAEEMAAVLRHVLGAGAPAPEEPGAD
ncbi:TetR/AcrR family transcriptional regulator [Nocardiopsis potens]|uniref:TetR/AcrR family transcriptional regulator n=1 Tax=Nocardiopsis potens TaxID=1246458 RepID=UPI00034BBAED|nr:TetR family transcriptional regulator [Nocardiopsis potens]